MTSTLMGYDMIEYLRNNFKYNDGFLYRTTSLGGEPVGNRAGWCTVCNGKPYWKLSVNKKTTYLHHAIFLFHHGYIPTRIDHVDGNTSNNKIENLRAATQSQNMGNSKMKSTNTSGYKGVSFRKDTNKWNASIMVNGKHISLGSYENKEDAAKAYSIGAKQHFKEFAKLDCRPL
jgi:hypothetical protein